MALLRQFSFAPWPLIGGLGLLLIACQAPQAPSAAPEKIFRKGRRLTYNVAHFAPGSSLAYRLDTLAFTSFGDFKPGQYDTATTQIRVVINYNGHSDTEEIMGVIEQDSVLWSHPPRQGRYGVLELSPFPYIKLPAAVGSRWTWDLGVGDHWSSPQWKVWRGLLNVHSTYRVVGQRVVPTQLGRLRCWVVQAQVTCPLGASSLEMLYHPSYGFVQLTYRTITGERIAFTLVKEATEPVNEPFEPSPYLQLTSPR